LVAGVVSLAIGTSMGTIAAVVPIAIGVADAAGLDRVLVTGAVVGGAMFGDNLSVISDTTIAATRTQGAQMRDKFRENFRIALPAALLTMVLLGFAGDPAPVQSDSHAPAWLALPYLLVLVLALAGLDVLLVLGIGLALAGCFGLAFVGDYDLHQYAGDIWIGFEGMVEILLLSLMIGGLAGLMQASGGLAWLARVIARFARGHTGRRSGEFSIAALATTADVFTANNTVAILVGGSVARDIAQRHGISPRRAASVLDIFACVPQGLLPYGAQLLLASSLAAVSPLALAGSVWYCWLLALVAIGFMAWPRRTDPATAGQWPDSVARLQLGQRAQELDVQPHQGDHQAERAVPLHVLRRAVLDAAFDEVEVQHQVHRRDHDHEQAEADADQAAFVDQRDLDAEEAQCDRRQVHQRDATGGCDHAELEVLGGLDQAAAVGEQHREQGAEGEHHRLHHDAFVQMVEQGRDRAQEEALDQRVQRRGDRRPGLLERGDQGQHQAADRTAPDIHGEAGCRGAVRPEGLVPGEGRGEHHEQQ